MEQIIEAFGIDWRLIAIQMFNFAILMGILWYFLYTPILKILKEREDKIAKGVREAEEASVKLQEADREKKQVLTEAQIQAEDIALRAKSHAIEKSVEILEAAEIRAHTIVADAEAKGEGIKVAAHKASEAEIAKVAILAAEKILREKNS